MFLLNLVIGISIILAFPGTAYTSGVAGEEMTNATQYEAHFNATEIAEGWDMSPLSGVPIIGDIFAGFNLFWQYMGYLIDGFPSLLVWIGDSLIGSYEGQVTFTTIANVIRAAQALLIAVFLIEFISGRVFSD